MRTNKSIEVGLEVEHVELLQVVGAIHGNANVVSNRTRCSIASDDPCTLNCAERIANLNCGSETRVSRFMRSVTAGVLNVDATLLEFCGE